MKKLLLLVPFILFGCSSIKWVIVEKGQIVTQDNQPISILGNPPITCYYENSLQTFSGYFMYQRDDGSMLLDDFGRGTIQLMDSPICRLRYEE